MVVGKQQRLNSNRACSVGGVEQPWHVAAPMCNGRVHAKWTQCDNPDMPQGRSCARGSCNGCIKGVHKAMQVLGFMRGKCFRWHKHRLDNVIKCDHAFNVAKRGHAHQAQASLKEHTVDVGSVPTPTG